MITEKLMTDVLEFIKSKIGTAEMVIDGVVEPVQILDTKIEGNLLKIFTNTTKGKGTITDLYIKDDDGNVVLSKPRMILKTHAYGVVSSFYIQLEEKEIPDPINIFETVRGGTNG